MSEGCQNLSAQALKVLDFNEKRLHWESVIRVSTANFHERLSMSISLLKPKRGISLKKDFIGRP